MSEKTTQEIFVETTTNIVNEAKNYEAVDDMSYQIFMEVMSSYLNIHEFISKNSDLDFTNRDVKFKLFEQLFNINFDDEVTRIVENKLKGTDANTDIDEDINNADNELLKNIKSNIQEYLK